MLSEKIKAEIREILKNQIKIKVVGEELECIEYGENKFKTLPMNRDIDEKNVLMLVKSMAEINPVGTSVLVVIRTKAWSTDGIARDYMCDGHHRRQAALELSTIQGSPVPLSIVIIEIDGEDNKKNVGNVLHTINVRVGSWDADDYNKYNSENESSNSKDYKTYKDYIEKYGHLLANGYILTILSNGSMTPKKHKEGKFMIPNIKKADAILDVIEEIGFINPKKPESVGFPHNNIKRSLISILISMEMSDIKESTSKLKKFLKTEKFSLDEKEFQRQLIEILKKEEVKKIEA